MLRQLTYLRDGRFIDFNTAEVMAILVTRASDNTSINIVEIRTVQGETGGFRQTARVLSLEAPTAGRSKWQRVKWLIMQIAPIAFTSIQAAQLIMMFLPSKVQQQHSSFSFCSCGSFHCREKLIIGA
jgi:hypothetical protein